MIDPGAVTELLTKSLMEDATTGTVIRGIAHSFAVDVDAVEPYRDVIKGWITDLPSEFLAEGGGGWSFLNLCQSKDGDLWGQHRDCEALFVLASSIGLAKVLLPPELWSALPGGVPYLAFTLDDNRWPTSTT